MTNGISTETAVAVKEADGFRPGGSWNSLVDKVRGDKGDRAVAAATSYVRLAVSRGVDVTVEDAAHFGDAVVPPFNVAERETFETTVRLAAALATNQLIQVVEEIRI